MTLADASLSGTYGFDSIVAKYKVALISTADLGVLCEIPTRIPNMSSVILR
jgi:hypothetical protein